MFSALSERGEPSTGTSPASTLHVYAKDLFGGGSSSTMAVLRVRRCEAGCSGDVGGASVGCFTGRGAALAGGTSVP